MDGLLSFLILSRRLAVVYCQPFRDTAALRGVINVFQVPPADPAIEKCMFETVEKDVLFFYSDIAENKGHTGGNRSGMRCSASRHLVCVN
nr:hypothetical protein [Lachnospiraceae bacterium]